MSFFNRKALIMVARDRGYPTEESAIRALAEVLGIKPLQMSNKIKWDRFTMPECEVIGSFFEMTMNEYYHVFMNGLFVETKSGRYIAHVENYTEHLYKYTRSHRQKKRNDIMNEILEEIEEI